MLAARERRGWTQTEAAEAAGVTRQSYAAIESGASVPSTEVALRLARAFSRAVEELFRLPEPPVEEVRARWAGEDAGLGRRVRLVDVAGQWIAYPTGGAERPSRLADGVVTGVEGSEVRVMLLPERPPAPSLAVVGCDPAFGIVAEALGRERGIEIVWAQRGSRAALDALARGEAHVGGTHLQDRRTGEANARWVRERVPFGCTRFRFADWEQGLIVPAGNPAGVSSIADLARPGVRLLNREDGSGSRMLLDEELEAAGVSASGISGYATAARSHLAVGEAIAAGVANVGIGIRAAGAAFGLGVVPLRTERYEMVIPDHFLDLPAVGALLDVLRQPGIRTQIEALQGYDAAAMGKAV